MKIRQFLMWVCLGAAGYIAIYNPDLSKILDWIHVVDPTPPAPVPNVEGLHVLFIEESSKRKDLTEGQRFALFAKDPTNSLRAYAESHCHKYGNDVAFRVIDKESPVGMDQPWVVQAMALPHDKIPWMIVSNGKAGFSGPMPEKEEDIIAIVKKYGGP